MDANDFVKRGGILDFSPEHLTRVQTGVTHKPPPTAEPPTTSPTAEPSPPPTASSEPKKKLVVSKAVVSHFERRKRRQAEADAINDSFRYWSKRNPNSKNNREARREAKRARTASTTTTTTATTATTEPKRPLEDASSTTTTTTTTTNAPPPPPPPNTPRPLEEASPPPDDKPSNVVHCRTTIRVEPGRSDLALARVESVLGLSGEVFERGGKLVALGSFRGRLPKAYQDAMAGVPQARASLCTSSAIACALARHADVAVWNTVKSSFGPGLIPEHITTALLDSPSYPSIPHLAGVVEVPTIDRNGRVIDTPGYDEATCLWYEPRDHNHNAEPLTVGTTLENAKAACATLFDFVSDFPFIANHDRAAWLAYTLTIAGRHAIEGPTPAFTFSAPSKRTGKTYLTEIGSIIGTGHSAADARLDESGDERGKFLTALMMQGARVVRFDNLPKGKPFMFPQLESTLTTGVWTGRLLGKGIVVTGVWHAVLVASGIDLTIGLEMSGRCVACVLDAKMEHPEDRTDFKELDIIAAALRDQQKLRSAALTILRAHALAGRPTPIAASKEPWGDYAAWQKVVRSAVLWAYGHDPIGGRTALRKRVSESDDETAALKALYAFQTVRGGMANDDGPAWWTVKEVHDACCYSKESADAKDTPPRDEYRTLRSALSTLARFKGEGAPSRQRIASTLSSLVNAPRAGVVLQRIDEDNDRKVGATYRVVDACSGDFVRDASSTPKT